MVYYKLSALLLLFISFQLLAMEGIKNNTVCKVIAGPHKDSTVIIQGSPIELKEIATAVQTFGLKYRVAMRYLCDVSNAIKATQQIEKDKFAATINKAMAKDSSDLLNLLKQYNYDGLVYSGSVKEKNLLAYFHHSWLQIDSGENNE